MCHNNYRPASPAYGKMTERGEISASKVQVFNFEFCLLTGRRNTYSNGIDGCFTVQECNNHFTLYHADSIHSDDSLLS